MQNRVPVPREDRAPLPDFKPVPRKFRHDGWTPERQKAFIECLADTGSVTRAAGMVNIAQRNAYALRRAPGAEEFRRAWDVALDFGVKRLKDIAFERAAEGELIPVFAKGKLLGYRRKYNDALLMFCLRHYGQDDSGRRTTINYFSTRTQANAGAGAEASAEEGAGAIAQSSASASAEVSSTTVRTVINGDGSTSAERDDALAAMMQGFEGAQLDEAAQAEIMAALEACAARRRQSDANIENGGVREMLEHLADPSQPYVAAHPASDLTEGVLEQPALYSVQQPFTPRECPWRLAGEEMLPGIAAVYDQMDADAAEKAAAQNAADQNVSTQNIAEVKRPKARNNWDRKGASNRDGGTEGGNTGSPTDAGG